MPHAVRLGSGQKRAQYRGMFSALRTAYGGLVLMGRGAVQFSSPGLHRVFLGGGSPVSSQQ